MCLMAWNWQPDADTPLVLLSNRDEFYARPTLPLHWWPDGRVLAGRDQQGGGSWLGVARNGRLAAVTNHRSPTPLRTTTPSRGELVTRFLQSEEDAASYLQRLVRHAGDYNPFNLLVFDGAHLLGLESRNATVVRMQTGMGAVSNADFQTPWPKLERLRQRLQTQLDQHATNTPDLLALLHDRAEASQTTLPHTGLMPAMEQALSATFIVTPTYGTRACSVVKIHRTHTEFTEESYSNTGLLTTTHQTFQRQS